MAVKMKCSEEELHQKMKDWCNKAERCASDLKAKMARYGAEEEIISRCLRKLENGGFFDDARFAKAFVHDRSVFARWGVRKIKMHLQAKKISSDHIDDALKTIDGITVHETIRDLASTKSKTIRAKNLYDHQSKLTQFLMRKGFTYDQIRTALAGQLQHDIESLNP